MLTSEEILFGYRAAVLLRTGKGTDYRVAKEIGAGQQTIYQWQRGGTIAAKYAVKIGEYTNLPTRYLVACLEAQRARDPISRQFWSDLARDFQPSQKAIEAFTAGNTGEILTRPELPKPPELNPEISANRETPSYRKHLNSLR